MVDSSQSSALTARDRLLHDRQMRCYHTMSGSQSGALAFSPSSIIRPQALSPRKLSLAEQQRQAIQIARTFDHHYLAAMRYGDEDGVVTAIIKPIQRRDARREVAHEIGVDAAGNVNIARCDHASVRRGILFRVSMLAVGTALLVGSVLAIL
jgi:hypothetical protein